MQLFFQVYIKSHIYKKHKNQMYITFTLFIPQAENSGKHREKTDISSKKFAFFYLSCILEYFMVVS